MPPRNLLHAIALGALAVLAHPFAFVANAAAAAGSGLGWATRGLIGSRQAAARRKIDTAQWTPELLKRLEWRRFEELCAAYFETLGFRVELARAGADSGAAINLYAQGSESAAIIVRCSPWNAHRVGIKPVRGLRGVMSSGNVAEGVLLTPGKFTQEARDFAVREKISLIDGLELVAKIRALMPEQALALLKCATEGDFLTPTCPSCAIKMISRKSTAQGRTYWGCRNYPACKHTFFETS
jgi:restriction system protein